MSLRSRRRARRSRTFSRWRAKLGDAFYRMERDRGETMNIAWLSAAADASEALDALTRLGRPPRMPAECR